MWRLLVATYSPVESGSMMMLERRLAVSIMALLALGVSILGACADDHDRRVKLPVDAYYPSRRLVVEYHERQHTGRVDHFDKPDELTVSGVDRGEQRRLYDQRRREVLNAHGIRLVVIDYSALAGSKSGRLKRAQKADLQALSVLLSGHLP